MVTTIAIEGAEFFAYHGYYEAERKTGNTFILNVEVDVKTFDSADDNITDTINYESLYTICKNEMGQTRKLLETVVFDILETIKEKHESVVGARVEMKKKGPQLGGKVDFAIVRMSY